MDQTDSTTIDNESQYEEQKFQSFKKWFQANGGYCKSIKFPARFDPGDYLGMCAENQIPPNSVILAVPKALTIGISTARQSELRCIIDEHPLLNDQEDDDRDYNVLSLFLIMQKMKGENSFFYPYIRLLDSSETVMTWQNPEIQAIKDPYINLPFIDGIRKTFDPVFNAFQQIASKNKHIFPKPLTKQLFSEVYAAVMTRGFGWGLPETMLVPYADFLNHSSSGVHHYVFERHLENMDSDEGYIKKKYELDLRIFPGIDNSKLLPVDYEMNLREKYIFEHKQKIKEMGLSFNEKGVKMDPHITNPLYDLLIESVIQSDFDEELYLSTDSEDNDSEDETQLNENLDDQKQQSQPKGQQNAQEWSKDQKKKSLSPNLRRVLMERKYLKHALEQVEKQLEERFSEPKPNVNSQFEDGVKFDWWWKDFSQTSGNTSNQNTQQNTGQPLIEPRNDQNLRQKQQKQGFKSEKVDSLGFDHSKYFIVASSKRIYQNEQIFNCYGRRSNRFLLIWYGFCFENNKYDSVPFRIWSQEVTKKTGHVIYTKFLTQKQYSEGIPMGNERYNVHMLTDEFRLKNKRINYQLLAFERYRYLKSHRVYRQYYKENGHQINRIVSIDMEIQAFMHYQRYLNELIDAFDISLTENIVQSPITNPSRKYFLKILENSNRTIILKNLIAVNQMLKILSEISSSLDKLSPQTLGQNQKKENQKFSQRVRWIMLPKQMLKDFYSNSFKTTMAEKNKLIRLLISNYSETSLSKELKLMIRDYFRLLSKSLICKTLETDFC